MEALPLVKKLLADDEKCLISVRAGLVDNGKKISKYLVIVNRAGDKAVLIFSTTQVPCSEISQLSVMETIPINKEFSYKQESEVLVEISNNQKRLRFDLSASQTVALCKELKQAKETVTHVVGFGLPSSFSWLDKYTNKAPEKNLFETDVFDPLKYMNIEDNGKKEPVKDDTELCTHASRVDASSRLQVEHKPRNRSPVVYTRKGTGSGPDSRSASPALLHPANSNSKLKNFSDLARSNDSLNETFDTFKNDTMDSYSQKLTPRENMVSHLMMNCEDEYTNIQKVKVFCGTWNVNGQSPTVSIHTWLASDPEPPDIYAVGFQELDLSKEAFIFSESPKEGEWLQIVTSCLHPKAKYKKVKLIRLVGVMLIVFVTKELSPFVKYIDADYVATGIMGLLGNKGGVAVRMTIHNTSLCFINSHLAAHQEEFERRNQDYRDIVSRLRFRQFVPHLTMHDHEVIFWIGDLNYRLSEIDINDVKKYIDSKVYSKLFPYDQLYKQLGKSDVFKGFTEGDISFRPTYKYDTGTDNWDSSEKCRAPAWCDRILWKGSAVCQSCYRSHNELKISDHKPVSSIFDVGLKVVDEEKSKKVYEDIMKRLDRLENEYLPQVKIDIAELNFGEVKFYESKKQKVVVSNTGQGLVEFEFIKKLNGDSYCKPWLKITPYKAFIKQDGMQEVELEVYVDEETVSKLNSHEDKIEDILVLHLIGGKDCFITVSGNFIPTSFGSSIEALIQMQQPIREVPVAQLIDLEQPGSLKDVDIAATGGRLYAVPKEIWRLIDHLFKYGRSQEDLFKQDGLNTEIYQIRDCLDAGAPEKIPGSIHSVTSALILFLRCLPEPVIPCNVYHKCLQVSNNYNFSRQVLSSIPEHNRTVFKYICAFLRELLEHSEANNLDHKTLASIFGHLFLRPLKSERNCQADTEKKAMFVFHFLVNEYDE
ncbi:inositol polyphosphate 5-phosphatase OCRL isoform X2 [Octopus bimaculoides]|uniref:inositol polyphosphate 5-phosphatase OCRL isoform X2 n=1 Tax=Octopus bimaculoides TaxID=37653 RepID=UPI0022E6A520|nr:inositol polyphosphate 5-phosphatase OCRL isoform X2 [Octopus bimaculoides]